MDFKKGIVFLSVFLFAFILKAQDAAAVTFEMKLSKSKLGLNERLRVDFTMNKDGDNFNPPDFAGFRVLMGPSQAISSSWINGVRSYSKSYSYTLAPTAKGKFTINQATGDVVVNGNATFNGSVNIKTEPDEELVFGDDVVKALWNCQELDDHDFYKD